MAKALSDNQTIADRNRRRVGVRLVIAALVIVVIGAVSLALRVGTADALRAGQDAYAHRDWDRALALARRAMVERPGDVEAQRLLARTSARIERHPVARQLFDRVGPTRLEAEDEFLYGAGLMREGRNDVGRQHLEQSNRLDPNYPETLYELGRLDVAADRVDQARPWVERLASIPGWEARGLVLLGLIRSKQADPHGAALELERAIARDPRLSGLSSTVPEVRQLIARERLKAGQPAAAREQLKIALAADPNPAASWLASRAAIQLGERPAALDALARAGDYGSNKPQAFEPAPFVGEAKCAPCHADLHRLARGTRHAKTYTPAAELDRLDLPAGQVVDPDNPDVVHVLARKDGQVAQVTHAGSETYRALLAYAVGSGDRGLTPVGRDDSGQYRELRLSYYGDIHGWDRTTGHDKRPAEQADYLGDPLGNDSIRRCLDCHTTNFRAARDRVGPEAADRGIGCERCHGPGGNHLKAIALKLPDPAIGRPRLASPEQVIELCGQCHGPRGRLLGPDDPTAPRFQTLVFPRSRCYIETGKGLDCVSCHNPHRDADTAPDYYEAKCLACHGPETATSSAGRARHAPALPSGAKRVACPVNPAEKCLECHMPAIRATIPHTIFTDHHIRVHREKTGAEAD
jgi:tetratricopeptide (TPR) repeat protein